MLAKNFNFEENLSGRIENNSFSFIFKDSGNGLDDTKIIENSNADIESKVQVSKK